MSEIQLSRLDLNLLGASYRVFRVAMPTFLQVIHRQMNGVGGEAPGNRLEWLRPDSADCLAVAWGHCGLARLAGEKGLPEGTDEAEMCATDRASSLRKDHPALETWGAVAWSKWPLVVVSSTDITGCQFEAVQATTDPAGHIGAQISAFWGLGILVTHTDCIATFPPDFHGRADAGMGFVRAAAADGVPDVPLAVLLVFASGA